MPFPLLGAIGLGSKLLGGFLKGRGEKKKAESDMEARRRLYDARKGAYEAGQERRGATLDAVQGALGNVGGALPAGAPSYSFDPEVLARMKAALPFAETPESQMVDGDPSAGMGSRLLGGFVGGVGQAADTALLGQTPMPAIAPSSFNPETAILEGTPAMGAPSGPAIDWEEILRRRG